MSRDLYAHRPPRPRGRRTDGVTRRHLFGLPLTPVAAADLDFDSVGERIRSAWDHDGERHESLLRAIEPVAEVLADLAAVGGGESVLDVGAGDGNLARACLARGATVTACDFAPAMVARGRVRCPEATWEVADVHSLPYEDRAFDSVLSSFGAVLAADPARAAAELVRVARPGGVVGLTAWIPRGLPGRLDEFAEHLVPLPDGVPSPSEWGVQETVRARLEPLLSDLELRTRSVELRFSDPDAAFAAMAGPLGLEPAERAALRPHFDRLLASCDEGAGEVRVRARYLVVLGSR